MKARTGWTSAHGQGGGNDPRDKGTHPELTDGACAHNRAGDRALPPTTAQASSMKGL